MLAQKVSKGVLSVGAWTVTKVLVSALATPFLSRGLGTDGYGLYSYYFAIMLIAAPLASVGTLQTLAKVVSESPDPARRSRAATLSAVLSALGLIVVGLIVGGMALRDAPVSPAGLFAGILLVSIGADVVWYFARGILYGFQREELAGIPGSIAAVVGSVTSVGLVLTGFGLAGALLGILVGNVLMASAAVRSALRLCPLAPVRESFSSADPAPWALVGFSLTTMVYTGAAMLLYKSGVVLVHHLTGSDTQTGLFATALQMAEFVWVLIIAVEGVMLQTTSRLWREGQRESITALVSRLVRYASLVTVFFLVYVFVFAEETIRLYFGPQYLGAAPVLRILVPGVFSFSLARLLGPVLFAQGRVMVLTGVIVSAAILAIALDLVLVPVWGVVGGGVATTIAYGLIMVPYVTLLRASGVHPFAGFLPLRQLVLVLLTGMVMGGIGMVVPGVVARLAVGGIIGFLVFFVGALRLRLFSARELESIADSLPGRLRDAGVRLATTLRPVLDRVGAIPPTPEGP